MKNSIICTIYLWYCLLFCIWIILKIYVPWSALIQAIILTSGYLILGKYIKVNCILKFLKNRHMTGRNRCDIYTMLVISHVIWTDKQSVKLAPGIGIVSHHVWQIRHESFAHLFPFILVCALPRSINIPSARYIAISIPTPLIAYFIWTIPTAPSADRVTGMVNCIWWQP